MRNKKSKKGFTLVELLVVIAILAVLATVSVVGYMSFTKKAKVSNDTSLVAQLNLALQADEVADGGAKTPTDALEVVEEAGYIVPKLTPTTAKYDIIWNQETNRFALLDEKGEKVAGEPSEKAYYNWAFLSSYDDDLVTAKGFSAYLNTDFTGTTVAAKAGIDVGKNTKIETINYVGTTEAKDLLFRTNGGTLSIEGEKDNASHYGLAEKVIVKKIAPESYHENGYITSYLEVQKGHIAIESGASVSVLAVNGSDVTVDQASDSELYKAVAVGENKLDSTKIKVNSDVILDNSNVTADDLSKMKYGGGEGTEAKPYELYTASHLAAFAKDVNEGKITTYVYAKLCADVDISGMAWEPIGNAVSPFYGSFDGQDKTIKGLTNKGYTPSTALWGVTNAAGNSGTAYGFFGVIGSKLESDNKEMKLSNLKFTAVAIDTKDANMLGVLLGADVASAKRGSDYVNQNYSGDVTIENITTAGVMKCSIGTTIGGIVGKLYTKGNINITKCENSCNFELSNSDNKDIKAGGILGFVNANEKKLTITECTSNGNMNITVEGDNSKSGNAYVGGIISYHGSNQTSSGTKIIDILSCTVSAKISITSSKNLTFAGLIYGARDAGSRVNITNAVTTNASCVVNDTLITSNVCELVVDTIVK